MDEGGKILQCVIVTPERAVLDEQADFVALPMYDGEIGILPGRAPLIGRLGYGELRIRRGQVQKRYYVDGGFAQVRANVISVLTPKAVRAEEINTTAVSEQLERAHGQAPTPEAQAAQYRAEERTRGQLRVARRAHS